MDSPKRKQLKRNDYLRHKMFRKIRKQQKAELEQQKKAAEKELKRRLRVTPLPKFDKGLTPKDEYLVMAPEQWVVAKQRERAKILYDSLTGKYSLAGTGEVVTPLNRLVEDDPSTWTFVGENGRRFDPHNSMFNNNPGEIRQGELDSEKTSREKALDAVLRYSNEHYNNPILGAPARWNESWKNDTNPVKALWNSPFGYVNWPLRFAHAVENDFGIQNFENAYNAAKLHDFLPFISNALEGSANASFGAEGVGKILRTINKLKVPTLSLKPMFEDSGTHIEIPEGAIKNNINDLSQEIKAVEYNNPKRLSNSNPIESRLLTYELPRLLEDYRTPEEVFSKTNPNHRYTKSIKKNGLNLSVSKSYLVDEHGDIDTHAVRNILDYLKSYPENVFDNVGSFSPKFPHAHWRRNAPVEDLTTLRHLWESAKTAQSSPTPKGSTKQQQVLEALSHDIGELYGRRYNHAQKSADLMKTIIHDIDPSSVDRVAHHMDMNVLYSLDDALKALKFADKFAGSEYEKLIDQFPDFGYKKQDPVTNLGRDYSNIPIRDVYKYHINPVLKQYGYDTIPLDISESEQRSQLLDRIKTHKTFVTGLYDPRGFMEPNQIEEFYNKVRKHYGLSPDQEPSMSLILGYSAVTQFGLRAPNNFSGRLGLHRVVNRHYLDPNTIGTSYTSNSNDVAFRYAAKGWRDGMEGEAINVHLPIVGDDADHPIDLWLKNSFPLYGMVNCSGDIGLSDYYTYDEPYRLVTGRSLLSDILQAHPEIEQSVPPITGARPSDIRYFGLSSDLQNTESVANELNETLQHFYPNSKFKFPTNPKSKRTAVAMARTLQDIDTGKRYLEDLKTQNDTNGSIYVERAFLHYFEDVCSRAGDKIPSDMIAYLYKKYKHGVLDFVYELSASDLDYIRTHLSNALKKIPDIYKNHSQDLKTADILYLRGLILERQRDIKRLARQYKKEIVNNAGVVPQHKTDEILDNPFIFTTEGLRNNLSKAIAKTILNEKRRQTTAGYLHYVIVGKAGEKILIEGKHLLVPPGTKPGSDHKGRPSNDKSKKVL